MFTPSRADSLHVLLIPILNSGDEVFISLISSDVGVINLFLISPKGVVGIIAELLLIQRHQPGRLGVLDLGEPVLRHGVVKVYSTTLGEVAHAMRELSKLLAGEGSWVFVTQGVGEPSRLG